MGAKRAVTLTHLAVNVGSHALELEPPWSFWRLHQQVAPHFGAKSFQHLPTEQKTTKKGAGCRRVSNNKPMSQRHNVRCPTRCASRGGADWPHLTGMKSTFLPRLLWFRCGATARPSPSSIHPRHFSSPIPFPPSTQQKRWKVHPQLTDTHCSVQWGGRLLRLDP